MGIDNACNLYNKIKSVIADTYRTNDNYQYVMDVAQNIYYISPAVLERFDLKTNELENALEEIMNVVAPEDREELTEDLQALVAEHKVYHDMSYRWISVDGVYKWINCRGEMLKDEDGSLVFTGTINEIGRNPKADNTSGLRGEKACNTFYNEHAEKEQRRGYIIRFGIDNFKEINESHGLDYGDYIIKSVADRIKNSAGKGNEVFRILSDEYMIINFGDDMISDAIEIYNRVSEEINHFLKENLYDCFFTISAGIIDISELSEGAEFGRVMRLTEFALNEAKARGKNQYYIFSEHDYQEFKKHRSLINLMKKSVSEDFKGFETYFQPIVDYKTQKFICSEALLRFTTADGTPIPPYKFIPILEETGLIIPVGLFVMDEAMKMCKRMQSIVPGFRVGINVSYVQVQKSNMIEDIARGMKKYDIPPSTFVVELTESGFIESDESFLTFTNELRNHGVRLAIDDFGTGYSNFHYMFKIRPDSMKIDRSFTLHALESKYEMMLLDAIAQMAHSLDLKLVIEGIENEEELERIGQICPDDIQGYFFGKPMPAEEFVKTIEAAQ